MNNDDLKKMITKFVAMAILEADELPFVETAEYVAERLIAAGIGDVKAAEHRAEVAERLDKATELAYEYRTEADTLSCSSCPMFDYGIFDRCKDRGLYEECSKRWKEALIEQAEKELSEERKDEV